MKHDILSITTLSFLILSCSKEAPQVQHMKTTQPAADLSGIKVVNAEDPVCHMKTAEYLKDTARYKAQIYGFCSDHCKTEFKKNPENYLK